MPEIVKIVSFTAPHPSPKDSSKTVPAKFKDETGRDFAITRDLVDFVEEHQGQTVEIDFQSTINGKYTNRLLIAAKLIAQKPATNGSSHAGDWDKYKNECIARENALTSAIAYGGAGASYEEVLSIAQGFARWNLEGQVKNDGGPKAQLAKVDPEDNDESPPPWVGIAS